MEGTYTKRRGAKYTFIHDSVFEVCAYHYGQQFPEQMLNCMKSSYIANYVKLKKSEAGDRLNKRENVVCQSVESDENADKNIRTEDLCLRVSEDQYPLLAERLIRDIDNMKLDDVFTNDILKHHQVYLAFMHALKRKTYTELKSLFLQSKTPYDKKIKRKLEISMCLPFKPVNLIYKRWEENCVRGISWVIYYGHHKILQYIIEQTEEIKETESEIFNNERQRFVKSSFADEIKRNMYYIMSAIKSKLTPNLKEESKKRREETRLFLLGCYGGDPETVRLLMQYVSKETITTQHPFFSNTPLTAACEIGCVDVVEELLKVNHDINLPEHSGKTPLISACEGGYLSIVEKLLEAGADVNFSGSSTPLIAACHKGHVSIIEKLLKAGALINLPHGECEETPIIAACERGHLSSVQRLLKAGANVNFHSKPQLIYYFHYLTNYKSYCTISDDGVPIALFITLINNTPKITKLLIQTENRMTPKRGSLQLFDILHAIRHAGVKMNSKDDVVIGDRRMLIMRWYGFLWKKIHKGDPDVLRHLLRVGLQVNQFIQYGVYEEDKKSLLCSLIDELGGEKNEIEKIQILLDAGADVNIFVRPTWYAKNRNSSLDKEGVSALQRTKQMMCKYRERRDKHLVDECKRAMCEIKKHVRRYSVEN